MKHGADDERREFRWALPASLVAHMVIAALIIFGLPVALLQPEEEKAVEVELVPPPETPPEQKAEASPEAETPEPPPPEPPQAPPAQQQPEPPEARVEPPPLSVMRPVVQFGEKDAGPKQSPAGDSASEEPADAEQQTPDPAQRAEQDMPAEKPAPPSAPETLSAPNGATPTPPALPDEPAQAEKKTGESEAARQVFSVTATGDPLATTAMADLPRGVRAGRLCVTALRDQLQNALPPYYPDILPAFRLAGGNVLDVPKAAFRDRAQWYDLSYRCRVDDNATKVLSFSYVVGNPLSPEEWRRRGLPAQ